MTADHTPYPCGSTFENVAAVKIDGRWHFVGTIDQAHQCLRDHFEGGGGDAMVRAMDTIDAFRKEQVPADSVRAIFMVAAMAAGYPCELLPRDESLIERTVDAAAEHAIVKALG